MLEPRFAVRQPRPSRRTTNQVCEGELLQIDNRNNSTSTKKTYLADHHAQDRRRCARTCCLLGATFAGADDEHGRSAWKLYGLSLGTAFQIQDDILDIVGDAGTVGKTLGIDVEKGKMTLPDDPLHAHRPAASTGRCCDRCWQARDADKVEQFAI